MNHLQASQLAKLANVTVKTLHHYDKIGLLSPSSRAENGYRLYGQKDLLTLQQIVALKTLGFDLTQIKKLLAQPIELKESLEIQASLLQQKAEKLLSAAQFIQETLDKLEGNKSFDWNTVTKLLEVFTMTQQLENQWVANVLAGDELEQYAKFEAEKVKRSSVEKRKVFEQEWAQIVQELQNRVGEETNTEQAIALGKRTMDLVNPFYGPDNANLKNKIWHEGFKKGKHQNAHGMSTEMANWLDEAINAYWLSRIYPMLAKIDGVDDDRQRTCWLELLTEMCGHDKNLKKSVYAIGEQAPKLSQNAKAWLKKIEHETLG